jgi:5'-nucleotidase
VLILLTNDDGYRAAGLRALRRALAPLGRVVTVAPAREMSGVSHALTLARPLSVEEIDEDLHAVDGTPTDCTNLALNALLPRRPDVLVSGANHGPNLGDDVTYSGTVGAAIEGTLFGVPSVAVSQEGGGEQADYSAAASVTREIARRLGERSLRLPRGALLNVNVPRGPVRGVRATRLARRSYQDSILEREDPRGKPYYWVGGRATWEAEEGSDRHALAEERKISVGLLGTDLSLCVPGATPPPAEEGCLDASLQPLIEALREHVGCTESAGAELDS